MSPPSDIGYDRCSGQVCRAIIVNEGIIQFGIDTGSAPDATTGIESAATRLLS
jgi:hypothetical protein